MTTEIVEYKAVEAAIAGIEKYRGLVVDVSTPEGLRQGKEAQREAGAVRIALEKTRKKLKEDVLERGRQIDGQAKPLFERVAEIEDPIKAQVEAEERRKEAERVAAEQAELARIAKEEADRKAAEEARLAAERAEIARRQAALDLAEKEARDRRDAEEKASRERIAEQDRVARVAREAEEARVREESAKVAAAARAVEEAARVARLAEEERQRKARAEQEALDREAARKGAEINDSRSVLQTFVDRFGHMPVYAGVVKEAKLALKVKQLVAKGGK